MKVTVLMTLYDKGAFVGEAIASVLKSTWTDFELLIIDDASVDNGPHVVRSFNDPRIRLVTMERNMGRAAAASKGYAEARGSYIAVLDADDRMGPERLAEQVAYLDAHPEVAIVGSWLQSFGSDDELIRFKTGADALRAHALFSIPVAYPACMFRTELVQAKGVQAAVDWMLPGEDHLFMLAVGEHGDYANIDRPLTYYRVGEQNMAHGRDAYADRKALSAAILEWFKLDFSVAELETHMYFFHRIRSIETPAQVRALYRWKQRLIAEVPGGRAIPREAFQKEVEDRWRFLLPDLQQRVPKAALLHQWLSRDADPRRWARSLARFAGPKG